MREAEGPVSIDTTGRDSHGVFRAGVGGQREGPGGGRVPPGGSRVQ